MALIDKLTALGDAIREQTGKTSLLTLDAMVTEIKNIDFSKTTPINIIPDTDSSFTYDGTTKTPVWRNYDSEQLAISGTTSAVNAGTHKVYFTPKAGYTWADESVESKEVQWTIARKSISVPSQSGTLTYNGSSQSPSWSNYNSSQVVISGTTSGTNAGNYTATFTPNSNHIWSDGTTAAKNVTWTIGKQSLSTVPSQSGTLTYNGNNQSPSWSNYNSDQLTIGGTTSGTNAGSYTATFTPKSNYKWSDGTTTAKSVTWTIGKKTPTLSLSASSGSIVGLKGTTKTFTVTYNGDATISVKSSNTGVATVSISSKTVTIKSVATGSATITVSAAATTNYSAPSSKTYAVTTDVGAYLFKNGDQFTSFSGGWEIIPNYKPGQWHDGGYPTGTMSVTSDGYLKLERTGSTTQYGKIMLRTKNKIDLSNYSTLTCKHYYAYTANSNMNVGVCAGTEYLNEMPALWTSDNPCNLSNTTVTVDLSSVNGSYYVTLLVGYWNFEDTAYAKTNEIVLS